MTTVFVVVDHICEADINVSIFSTRELAEQFIADHRAEHEFLGIEEFTVDEKIRCCNAEPTR